MPWGCQAPRRQLWKGWGDPGGVPAASGGGWWQQRVPCASRPAFLSPHRVQGKTFLQGAATRQRWERQGCARVSPEGSFALCSPPSSTCQPHPGTVGLRAEFLPCCQDPNPHPVVPRVRSRAGGLCWVSCSRSCLGHPRFCRVSRLFQSHRGDAGWIRATLRAIPTSPCPCASPGVSCATQTQLNTALPSFPSVPHVSRGCPVVSLSPVQIYPYELLLVKTRGRNQLPKDVDRTRLEVRRAFFTGDKQGTEGQPWQRVGLVAM